jgi:hypothetical protein
MVIKINDGVIIQYPTSNTTYGRQQQRQLNSKPPVPKQNGSGRA